MRDWRARVLGLAAERAVVMVTIVATQGSAPREQGARMIVHAGGVLGSIGGGQLEYQEISVARDILARGGLPDWFRSKHRIILGPDAGQCCGGVVEVLHELIGAVEARRLAGFADDDVLFQPFDSGVPPRVCRGLDDRCDETGGFIAMVVPEMARVVIYGGGHVARALVSLLTDLPFTITWIDIERSRLPGDVAAGVDVVVTDKPSDHAARAPGGSLHLIMTHSHDLDYDICRALLSRTDINFVGLIGSATKRARFAQRLRREGLSDADIERLVCPIGLSGVPGKAPQAIAIATAAQLLTFIPAVDIS